MMFAHSILGAIGIYSMYHIHPYTWMYMQSRVDPFVVCTWSILWSRGVDILLYDTFL